MDKATAPSEHAAGPDKDQTRKQFRSLRSELSRAEQQDAAYALAHQAEPLLEELYDGAPGTIAGYLSVGAEPGTAHLMELLAARGYDVVVPVCEPGYKLSWTRWGLDVEMAPSPRSWVSEPVGPRLEFDDLPPLKLVLVPALVLDRRGNRMGHGGGYYDRFLASLYLEPNRPATVGVVHTHEVVEPGTFECDPHDMTIDGVLTPTEFSWFSR
ncbi:5-formyltetrahydrofolate cyclo-ligase [Arthrobacter roseus]|uniref:5-formyltetrahydrofolate cyclo-ligase n=1 Tax=Arthrobacter roseus TaxID=136274 RepID=UPI0019665E02|nr:5-formyltetrahydrofolate cyclo-ligase [Arthrobacter roseus]MBM7849235.1 5-formyltetrahydrofolate cyclo-ligase [Arthrobacter roseus]